MRRPKEVANDEWMAVSVIAGELIRLARAHPKKAGIVVLWHLWIYSLAFHHIAELQSLLDLIPFIH